jgi:DNA repair protein RadC/predicted ABC-type ATPase
MPILRPKRTAVLDGGFGAPADEAEAPDMTTDAPAESADAVAEQPQFSARVAEPEYQPAARRPRGVRSSGMHAGERAVAAFENLQDTWADVDQAAAKERARAAKVAEVDRQRQEREAARVAKAVDKQNRRALGQDIELDPVTGTWQQKTDLQGRPLFTEAQSEVEYDPKTGKPFQTERDRLGNVKRVDPDANKPIARHELQTEDDPNIYRQREAAGWEAIDPEKGIEAPDEKVRIASAKELYRRELRGIDDKLIEAKTRKESASQRASLTDKQREIMLAERDTLAKLPPEKPPTAGWLGLGAETQEEKDARAGREATRKARLAEIEDALAADDERRAASDEHDTLALERQAIAKGGLGGFMTRWQQRKAEAMRVASPEELQAAGEDLTQRNAALNAEAQAIEQEAAALEERAARGVTASQVEELQVAQAGLEARAQELNAAAEQQNAEAAQLRKAGDAHAARQIRDQALTKQTEKAQFDALRADPATAPLADKLEAVNSEMERRAADVAAMPDWTPAMKQAKQQAAEALKGEARTKQGQIYAAHTKEMRTIAQAEAEKRAALRAQAEQVITLEDQAAGKADPAFPPQAGSKPRTEFRKQAADALAQNPPAPEIKQAADDLREDRKRQSEGWAAGAGYVRLTDGTIAINPAAFKPEWDRGGVADWRAQLDEAEKAGDISPALRKQMEASHTANEKLARDVAVDAAMASDPFKKWLAANKPDLGADFDTAQAENFEAVRAAAGEFLDTAPGAWEQVRDKVGRFWEGAFQRTGADLATTAGILSHSLFGWAGEGGIDDNFFYQLGQSANYGIQFQQDPRTNEAFSSQLATGLGSTVGFMLPGAAVAKSMQAAGYSAKAIKLVTTLTTAAQGAAMQGAQQYQEARAAGLSHNHAMLPFVLGGLVGTSEIVPVGRWIERLGAKNASKAWKVVGDMVVEMLEEAGQETFQQASSNAIAKAIYDKNRDILEGVGMSAGVGGTVGAIMSLLISAATGVRAKMRAPAPGAAAAPDGAAPPVEIPGFDPANGNFAYSDQDSTEVLEAKLARIREAIPNVADDSQVVALNEAANVIQTMLARRQPATPEAVQGVIQGIIEAEPQGMDPQSAQTEKLAAIAAVKLAQGAPLDSLTAEEKAALKSKTPEGAARMDAVGGKPIITDAQRARMLEIFPGAEPVAGPDEATQRAQAISTKGGEQDEKGQKENADAKAGEEAGQTLLGEWTARGRDGTTVSIPLSEAANESQAAEKLAIALGEKRKAEGLDPAGELLDLDSVDRKFSAKTAENPANNTENPAKSTPKPRTNRERWDGKALSGREKVVSRILQNQGVDKEAAETFARHWSEQNEGDMKPEDLRQKAMEDFRAAGGRFQGEGAAANYSTDPQPYIAAGHSPEEAAKMVADGQAAREADQQAVTQANAGVAETLLNAIDETRQPAETKTPQQWAEAIGYRIIDPDGWRADGKSLDEPLTWDEFRQRARVSTMAAEDSNASPEALANPTPPVHNPSNGIAAPDADSAEGAPSGLTGAGQTISRFDLIFGDGANSGEQSRSLEAKTRGSQSIAKAIGPDAVRKLAEAGVVFFQDDEHASEVTTVDDGRVAIVLNSSVGKDVSSGHKMLFRNGKIAPVFFTEQEGKGYGERALDEEIKHVFQLLALRRAWVASGRKVGFNTFAQQEMNRIAADFKTRLEKAPANERKEAEAAMVAAFNLYYQRDIDSKKPSVTTAAQVWQLLEDSATNYSNYQFFLEWARQLRQLQDSGRMTEQTLTSFLKAIANWVKKAAIELKQFSVSIKDADSDLGKSRFARLIKEMEATQKYILRGESSLSDQDKAELEGLRQQRQEIADRRKAAQQKQQKQAEAAANIAGEIPPERRGATGYVLAANKQQIPSAYVLLDDAEVVASHDGQTFAKNPAYPGQNTRAYDDPASGEADKVARNAATYLPELDLSNTPSADSGPPVIARVIREDGTSVYAVVGGNSRRMMRDRLSPDQRAALDRATADAAPGLGFHDSPSPGQGIYRLIGTFDFREAGQREAFQSAVAATNAQETKAQGEAREAQIAAATAVPPETLAGLAFHGEPKAAQDWIAAQIAAGTLNANKLDHLTRPGAEAEAQAFVDRVLAASALRMPALESYLFSEQGRAQAGMPELAEAAIPAMVAMRAKGGVPVADAAARVLANAADYLTNGKAKTLRAALQSAAAQLEMGEGAETARILAQAVAARLATNKAGAINAEATGRALSDFFSSIQRGVELLDGEADMFGDVRTVDNVIRDAAGAAQPETLRARRSQKTNGQRILFLQRKAESTRNLTPSEAWELEMLERAEGQQFMPFAGEPTFALDREEAAPENPAAPAENSAQLALFARRSGIPMADDLREQVAEFANRARQAGLPGLNAVPTEVLLSWGAEWRQAHPWDRSAQEALATRSSKPRRVAAVAVLRARGSNKITPPKAEWFASPQQPVTVGHLSPEVLQLTGKTDKPVVITPQIARKNAANHPEITPEQSVAVIASALQNPVLLIQDKPQTKGNYWVFVSAAEDKADQVLVELAETKEAYEVVNWFKMRGKSLAQKINRAAREGGQVLMTSKAGAAGLSALASNSEVKMALEAHGVKPLHARRSNAAAADDDLFAFAAQNYVNTVKVQGVTAPDLMAVAAKKDLGSAAPAVQQLGLFDPAPEPAEPAGPEPSDFDRENYRTGDKRLRERLERLYPQLKTPEPPPRPPESQPELAPVADAAPPAAREIEDFGEKIGGARKDRAQAFAKATDSDIEKLPLSKVWPKSQVDEIEDIPMAALAHALRESIPTKPQNAWKRQRWADQVRTVRTLIDAANERGFEFVMEKLRDRQSGLQSLALKIDLLQAIPREAWGRVGTTRAYPDAFRYEQDAEGKTVHDPRTGLAKQIPSPVFEARLDDSQTLRGSTPEELTAKLKVAVASQESAPGKKMQWEVRRDRDGKFHINKKGDPLYRKLKEFDDAKAAFAFIKNNYNDLVAAWEDVKASDNVKETDVRGEENRPRAGQDWRKGQDVTPQMFMDAFRFKGVEFGNWVSDGRNDKERQGMLNAAYDALHDLAAILNIPTQAVSLNGDLGLGFGSRGHGKFAAHYEPDFLVINLTKTRGAGTLAHEWFHALDHYFQRKRNPAGVVGNKGDYITTNPEDYYTNGKFRLSATRFKELSARGGLRGEDWKLVPGVRVEVSQAFADLVRVLDASPMAKRARLNDKGKSGYWGDVIERAARAFENYVIGKMTLGGYHNDYLANVLPPELFSRNPNRYPYLLPEELEPVSAAFDALFGTMKTEPTEKGMALYARSSNAAPPFYSQLQAVLDAKMPNAAPPAQVKAIIDPAKGSGIKPEEIKWSGIVPAIDALAEEHGGKVPKDALREFLAADGALRLEEVATPRTFDMADLDPEQAGIQTLPSGRFRAYATSERGWTDSEFATREEAEAWLRDRVDEGYQSGHRARYASYQLPGGQNYREVVLAMPSKRPKGWTAQRLNAPDAGFNHWQINDEQGNRVTNIVGGSEDDAIRKAAEEDTYTSSHFPNIPNYVAHMRVNEREDAEGKPGLFIEEIQSDRHQAGRERGYAGDPGSEQRKYEFAKRLYFQVWRPVQLGEITKQEAQARWDAIGEEAAKEGISKAEIQDTGSRYGDFTTTPQTGIPDAPFRKDWPLQMFKRALRDAVAGGKEWIGWTPGEVQAERYDLSKQIDSLRLTPRSAGGWDVQAVKGGEVVIDEDAADDAALAAIIGKDLAKKASEDAEEAGTNDSLTYSGLDLKVGGEGMRGFYDNILPKEIGKYVKQWGAKVEKAALGNASTPSEVYSVPAGWAVATPQGTRAFATEAEAREHAGQTQTGTPIWRVGITPAMREGIETRGQALFARSSNRQNPIATDQETRQDDNAHGPDAQRIRETLAGTRLLPTGRGGLLQAAYADARAGSGAVRPEQGAISDPIESERQRLVRWALKNKRFAGWRDIAAYGAPDHEGTEHNVYFRDGRVLKVTHDKPLFVADTLERHILHDAAFGDETEIEAVFVRPDGGRIGLVLSQPFRAGDHPGEETIAATLTAQGCKRIGDSESYEGHGITISDTGPKNWIQHPTTGRLTPIDLRVSLDRTAALQARQSRVAEANMQAYFDFTGIPEAKQDAARAAIAAVDAADKTPYPRSKKAAERDSKEIEAARAAQAKAYKALLDLDHKGVAEAIKNGVPLSRLVLGHVSREAQPFNIRGAIIESPADLAAHMLAHRTPFFESLKIVVLDDRQQVIASQIVSVGTLNESLAHPRETIAVLEKAKHDNPKARISGFVVSHNHPSGDPSPSDADRAMTRRFSELADVVGIPLLDHVITNGESFFSFKEHGMMGVGQPSVREDKPKGRRPAPLPVLPKPEKGPEPGATADWEALPQSAVGQPLNTPEKVYPFSHVLQTADPDMIHILNVDTRHRLISVDRYKWTGDYDAMIAKMLRASSTQGTYAVLVSLPRGSVLSNDQASIFRRRMTDVFSTAMVHVLDMVTVGGNAPPTSAKEMGLMEDVAGYEPPAPVAQWASDEARNKYFPETERTATNAVEAAGGNVKAAIAGLRLKAARMGYAPHIKTNETQAALALESGDLTFSSSAPATFEASNATVTAPGMITLQARTSYHGTPHEIDPAEGFKLSKVGTGEGAQVYGWGLYFADNPAVAREYQISLSSNYGGATIFDRKTGKEIAHYNPNKITETPQEKAAWYVARTSAMAQQRFQYAIRNAIADKADSAIVDLLRQWDESNAIAGRRSYGNFYTVELDVEPGELLDWDKLASEQSEYVKQRIYPMLDEAKRRFAQRGGGPDLINEYFPASGIYRVLSKDSMGGHKRARETSEALRAAGIPGIRYLDQGSRDKPDFKWSRYDGARIERAGWRVKIDDDNAGNKTYAYVWPTADGRFAASFEEPTPGEIIDRDLGTFDTEQAAKNAVRDQFGVTYNYVIFDESKIRITHKNGERITASQALNARRSGEDSDIKNLDATGSRGDISSGEKERQNPAESPADQGPAATASQGAGREEVRGRLGGDGEADGGSRNQGLLSPAASEYRDPRLVESFGEDWPNGWDAMGFPVKPQGLPDDDPRLAETLDKTEAVIAEGSLANRLLGLKPGAMPRAQLRSAIVSYFMRGGQDKKPLPAVRPKTEDEPLALFMGGGGASGKTSMLRLEQEKGNVPKEGMVMVNPDEVREFLPEYDELNALNDSRSSMITHEEASLIANKIESLARAKRMPMLIDGTMKTKPTALARMAALEKSGYRLRLLAVLIDPYEALVRAYLRAKSSKRYVPNAVLLGAHKGFARALPDYIDSFKADRVAIYDNSPEHPILLSAEDITSRRFEQLWNRQNLNEHAETARELLESYGEGDRLNPLRARQSNRELDARHADLERRAKAGDKAAEAEAQALVDAAAAKAGYSFGPLFHGTPYKGDIEQFDLSKSGNNVGGEKGIVAFTDNEDFANRFAHEQLPTSYSDLFVRLGEKGKVYRAFLKLQRPFDARTMTLEMAKQLRSLRPDYELDFSAQEILKISRVPNRQYIKIYMPRDLSELSKLGYDGVITEINGNGPEVIGTEYAVFNSSQIKSADPFTYDSKGKLIPLSRRFNPALGSILRARRSNDEQMLMDFAAPASGNMTDAEALALLDRDQTDAEYEYHQTFNERLWNNPEQIVKTPEFEAIKKQGTAILTPEQAKATVDGWKQAAREEGRTKGSGRAEKVVLSLFDDSGVLSQPWEDAGYTVYRLDIHPESLVAWNVNVMDLSIEFLTENGLDMVDVVLAQPPCTDFASSGARWFKDKDTDGRTKASIELIQQTLAAIEWLKPKIWALENPIGRIKRLTGLPEARLVFDPFMYGDDYTKRTQIWGEFNADLPTAIVNPAQGSKVHKLRGDNPDDKRERSLTPEGFAYAFWMANRNYEADFARRVIDHAKEEGNALQARTSTRGQTQAEAINAALREVEGRIPLELVEKYRQQAMQEAEGAFQTGRPDLAFGAGDAVTRGVDQARTERAVKVTNDNLNAEAKAMLATDREGVKRRLLEAAMDADLHGALNDIETRAAAILRVELVKEAARTGDAQAMKDAQILTWAYREARATQARALGLAGRDPHKKRADRHRDFLMDALFSPDPKVEQAFRESRPAASKSAAIEALKTNLAKAKEQNNRNEVAALTEALRRERLEYATMQNDANAEWRKKVEAVIESMGITLDDLFSDRAELRLKGRTYVKESVSGLDDRQRMAVDMMLQGVSPGRIKRMTGLRDEQLQGVLDEVNRQLDQRLDQLGDAALDVDKFDLSALFAPTSGGRTLSPAERAARIAAIKRAMGIAPDLATYEKTHRNFRRRTRGKNNVTGGFDINNPDHVLAVADAVNVAKGGRWVDYVREVFINNILSAPVTAIANATGYGYTLYSMTVQRALEASFNAALGKQGQAGFDEFGIVFHGIKGRVSRAWELAVRAWDSERSPFAAEFLNDTLSTKNMSLPDSAHFKHYIPGKAGRVLRTPTRFLLAMDTFARTLAATSEVGVVALRLGKAQGKSGQALQDFVTSQVNVPGSASWKAAAELAAEWTFTNSLRTQEQGGGWIEGRVKWFSKLANTESTAFGSQLGSFIVSMFAPFITTPFRLAQAGLRKTWIGSGVNAMRLIADLRIENGRLVTPNFSDGQKLALLADGFAAAMLFGLLFGASEGDDDDEDKMFLVTGSRPASEASSGARELAMRTVPPQTIRIGGRNGVQFNYGRLDPFATMIMTTVDTIRVIKAMGQGKPFEDALGALQGHLVAQVKDKTFMRGMSDLGMLMEGTRSIPEWMVRQMASVLVPNLIRNPMRALDPVVRDTRTEPFSTESAVYTFLPQPFIAPPAQRDLHGREIRKGGNALTRALVPGQPEAAKKWTPADRFLINYNRENPNESWNPSRPSAEYTDPATGRKIKMTPRQYNEFLRVRGDIQMRNLLPIDSILAKRQPTTDDMEQVRSAMQKSTKQAREAMFGRPIGELLAN